MTRTIISHYNIWHDFVVYKPDFFTHKISPCLTGELSLGLGWVGGWVGVRVMGGGGEKWLCYKEVRGTLLWCVKITAYPFDRCLGSTDAETPVKFHSAYDSINTKLGVRNFARSYDNKSYQTWKKTYNHIKLLTDSIEYVNLFCAPFVGI